MKAKNKRAKEKEKAGKDKWVGFNRKGLRWKTFKLKRT